MGAARRLIGEPWFAFVFSAVACLIYAFAAGQDANWDQRNYHIYDVYALLHGRWRIDIAPAQLQTWFNPFGEAIPYFIIESFPPWLATVFLAIIPSLSASSIYFLTGACLASEKSISSGYRLAICWSALLAALAAPMFLSEVGTSIVDDFSAVLVICALILVVTGQFSQRSYLLAGLLLGFCLDIKVTNAVFIIGWFAAILIVERQHVIARLGVSGCGILASYLPIGGVWNLFLYDLFGNPVFPFYNNFFKSWAYAPEPVIDLRHRPVGLTDALSYIPKWALGGSFVSSESTFRDVRFLLALILLVLALPQVIRLLRNPEGTDIAVPFCAKPSAFLLVFTVSAFAVWLSYSGISRYAIPIEELAIIIIFILLALLMGQRPQFTQAVVMSTLMVVVLMRPAGWGRTYFDGDWFGFKIPKELEEKDALYFMLSSDGFSYVIPAFPESDVFVRLEGFPRLSPEMGLGRGALAVIRAYKGEIRTLTPAHYSLQGNAALKEFGLVPAEGKCAQILGKKLQLESCPLRLTP